MSTTYDPPRIARQSQKPASPFQEGGFAEGSQAAIVIGNYPLHAGSRNSPCVCFIGGEPSRLSDRVTARVNDRLDPCQRLAVRSYFTEVMQHSDSASPRSQNHADAVSTPQ